MKEKKDNEKVELQKNYLRSVTGKHLQKGRNTLIKTKQ